MFLYIYITYTDCIIEYSLQLIMHTSIHCTLQFTLLILKLISLKYMLLVIAYYIGPLSIR